MKKLVLLLLLIATPCWGQQEMKPVKKRRVFDKKFFLATTAVIGATLLDVETTARCFRSKTCAEANPIYGSHPSRAKLYGIKGSFAAFSIWSTWWWKRDDLRKMERYEHRNDPREPEPRLWEKPRPRWYVPAIIVGGAFGAAGIYNLTAKSARTSLPMQPASQPAIQSAIAGSRVYDSAIRPTNNVLPGLRQTTSSANDIH